MQTLTDDNFDTALNDGKFSIVMFSASWCGPCKTFKPKFQKMAESERDISFAYCDVEESGKVSGKLDIQSVPTFITFHGTEEVERSIGSNEASVKEILVSLKNHRVKIG